MAKSTVSTKASAGRKPARKSSSTKSTTATKTKATKKAAPKRKTAGEAEVTLDRRTEERRSPEPQATVAPPMERRAKVNRRRQIDPTTCERDYTDDEVEFMNALDVYKRKNGRMFPTCSEVLEVIRSLGYARQPIPPSSTEQSGVRSYSEVVQELDAAASELDRAL